MNLWLDDVRPAPAGYIWVKDIPRMQMLLSTTKADKVSLDHDLGTKQTGYDLLLWMERYNLWPREVLIHSMNPVGRRNMEAVLARRKV